MMISLLARDHEVTSFSRLLAKANVELFFFQFSTRKMFPFGEKHKKRTKFNRIIVYVILTLVLSHLSIFFTVIINPASFKVGQS